MGTGLPEGPVSMTLLNNAGYKEFIVPLYNITIK
jgi:hypothetical protein